MKKIKVDKVILYYMDRVDPDGNLYRFYVYKGMASEIELHHKIESKILQYWGEDSGILIGITPIYKRRLWSKEVNVINDKQ